MWKHVLLAVLVLSAPLAAQTPLYAHAFPASSYLDGFGPSTESGWETRQFLGNVLDVIMTPHPTDPTLHSLVDPQRGPFISLFHKVRTWSALNRLGTLPPPPAGTIRMYKLYSSSWILEASSGKRIAVDYHEGPFNPNALAPNLFPLTLTQMDSLANKIDAYFITHEHADHVSVYLAFKMVALGKPVFCTQSLRDTAIALGQPWAAQMEVPVYAQDIPILPGITFTTFSGMQWGSWIDPTNFVGDPGNPITAQNNCYLFDLDGVGVMHFGDNNEIGVVSWATQCQAAGWDIDVFLNVGLFHDELESIFQPEMKMLTHELEFHHLGSSFINLNIGAAPNPNRRVLIWGEHLDFAPVN